MCGIFGGISIKDSLSVLNLMGDALAHRGPDDEGVYVDRNIALGHRRLSIIDLVSGHQPMFSQDKQQVIVYNGEIYNFKEIKEELIKEGYLFKTESDTEVIINSYREWGYDCLDRFNGMFAFALWDNSKRKLWLVRDRVGKKPLYFMKLSNSFYFASEARALWKVPGFSGEYDFRAIDQYLTFRYVPGTRTFYKGIKKLAAGSWMVVDRNANICQLKQWWSIPQSREYDLSKNNRVQDYFEEFHNIFSSAVKLRLISDVPIGLFLSSGIDSSSIAFEMAKVSRPTFISIGFGEKTDELDTASLLAKKLGAHHYAFLMDERDFDLLPQAVASIDEPYGDQIILPTFLLAKKASEKVKVILTGDGGDEILGGYIHHEFFRKVPKGLPPFFYKAVAALIAIFPPAALNLLFQYPSSLGKSGKERLCNLFNSYPEVLHSYMNFSAVFTKDDKERLYSFDFKTKLHEEADEVEFEMRSHFNRKDIRPFDKVLQWDMKTWLPEQTLMKLDRLTMANSMEGRCPYADYRLIEFLLRIPLDFFHELSRNKHVIRRLYMQRAPFLPKKKQAFYLPLNNIFNHKTQKLIEEVLHKDNLKETGWFQYDYLDLLLQKRKHSSLLVDKQIMSLVILILWLKSPK
jgi:asparagine synthase (glutamine-hydrolysing)